MLWIVGGIAFYLVSVVFAYGCGSVNGERVGEDYMKREAIRAGVAKPCDFDGGWRFYTREELGQRYAYHIPAPVNDDSIFKAT